LALQFGSGAWDDRRCVAEHLRDRTLLCLLMLSVAAMACFAASDGDLGFHLATGREVLATGRIPSTNVLSYTEPSHAWLLHQWLPGVFFELLWRRFGIAGVTSLKMAVVSATFAVVYAACRAAGARAVASFSACLLAAAASAFRFESRPYLFTHLTLALCVLAIARHAHSIAAGDARGARRALAGAMLAAAVASQLHAGAIDSFIVMLLAAAGCTLEPLRARVLRVAVRVPHGLRAAAAWVAAACAGFALGSLALAAYHPLGPRIQWFPFTMAGDAYLARHLVEFRHAWSFPVAMLPAFWLFLAAVAAAVIARVRTLHATWIALALAYAVVSLRFVRMAFAFGVVAAPALALALDAIRAPRLREVRPWLRVAALALLACAAPAYVYRDHQPGFGFASSAWPLAHYRFIREHALRGHAFVSDAWAGTFLGFFYPQRKSFYDNRMEAYSPELIQRYQDIRYGKPGWDRELDRYGVEIVLLCYTTPGEAAFQHGAPNLRQLLARDARYTLVRFDDDGELFVRTHGANAAIAERFALRGIDPDRRRFVADAAESLPALQHAIARGERSATLFGMTALGLAMRGEAGAAGRLVRDAEAIEPGDPWLAALRRRLAANARN
jgi:hypothetical protein